MLGGGGVWGVLLLRGGGGFVGSSGALLLLFCASECIIEPKKEVEKSNWRVTCVEELVEVGAKLNFLWF